VAPTWRGLKGSRAGLVETSSNWSDSTVLGCGCEEELIFGSVWSSKAQSVKFHDAFKVTSLGIHVIDAFIHLFGKVSNVNAQSRRIAIGIDIDDSTLVRFNFENGCTGHLTTIAATNSFWQIRAFGTGGWGLDLKPISPPTYLAYRSSRFCRAKVCRNLNTSYFSFSIQTLLTRK